MAWIQVDAGIKEHDKIFNLADTLNITDAHAVGLMVCLWTWAVTAAPDGDITNFPPRAIAKAAGWDKKADIFYSAIQSSSSLFVESVDGRLRFRNWENRAALLMDMVERGKEQTRKRVQRYRERQAEKNAVTEGINDDNSNAECNVTERYIVTDVTHDVTNVTVLPKPNLNLTLPNHNLTTNTPLLPQEEDKATITTSVGYEETATVPTRSDPVPFAKIQDLYNTLCIRLPKIESIEGNRRKSVSARYKTYGMEGFRRLFEKAAASDFLAGGGKNEFVAKFDWLISPTNMQKVIEGNYDNRPNPQEQPLHNGQKSGNRYGVNTQGILKSIINGEGDGHNG
jgi:hypothetical protein